METGGKQIPRRRMAWIGLAILLGVPALAIMILKAIFTVQSIPQERMTPPADLVQIKVPAGAAPIRLDTSDQSKTVKQYLEFIKARRPSSPAVGIYEKWLPQFESDAFKKDFGALFEGWLSNRPLTPGQTQWLMEHRDLIDDLFRLAGTEAATISFEDALACNQVQLWRLEWPVMRFDSCGARILIAESRRRRDAGDPAGAVDAIEAVERLARSFGRPLLQNQQVAARLTTLAFDAYGYWIEDSMPPETARRVREHLVQYAPADFRPHFELEYRRERELFIAGLSSPFGKIFENQLHRAGYGGDIGDPIGIAADAKMNYLNTVGFFKTAVWTSVNIKANASRLLDEFDANYREMSKQIAPGQALRVTSWPDTLYQRAGTQGTPVIRVWESLYVSVKEENTALTRRNLDLAVLDRLLGNIEPTKFKDPFSGGSFRIAGGPPISNAVVYSIGPDEMDDHARIVYDPTNGTCSAGDMILRLTKK
ncbi:hypothetical protein LLG95_08220 [bacterium]|nr:hypothetical protein [bacterium]